MTKTQVALVLSAFFGLSTLATAADAARPRGKLSFSRPAVPTKRVAPPVTNPVPARAPAKPVSSTPASNVSSQANSTTPAAPQQAAGSAAGSFTSNVMGSAVGAVGGMMIGNALGLNGNQTDASTPSAEAPSADTQAETSGVAEQTQTDASAS